MVESNEAHLDLIVFMLFAYLRKGITLLSDGQRRPLDTRCPWPDKSIAFSVLAAVKAARNRALLQSEIADILLPEEEYSDVYQFADGGFPIGVEVGLSHFLTHYIWQFKKPFHATATWHEIGNLAVQIIISHLAKCQKMPHVQVQVHCSAWCPLLINPRYYML